MCFKERYPEILEDLKKAHFYYRSTFNENALQMARAEGERNVVLRIMTIMDMQEKGEINDG